MTDANFTLDGQTVTAQPGETLWAAAQRVGISIPHLCHSEGLSPVGNCRACMVEVAGERTLAASCCRAAAPGMTVQTQSPRALQAQRMVLALLLSDAGSASAQLSPASELSHWAQVRGVASTRLPTRPTPPSDSTHAAIAVNMDACIQCTRCLRACRDVQVNDVIGLAGRGAHARIVFDAELALGESTCVGCGECVQACPTGALMPVVAQAQVRPPLQATALAAKPVATVAPATAASTHAVASVCPYCGVGCQLNWHVGPNPQGEQVIQFVTGRDGPANAGRLCVKGRYGHDYVRHAQRLTRPLIRKAGVAKNPADIDRFNRGDLALSDLFREASWDEALDAAAGGLKRIRDATPAGAPSRLAGFGSAKGSNEEAYLFQKLVRTGFGTNNVDHCTRLCHASSVAALLEGIGSGAVSNPVRDVQHADVVLIIGANPSSNHPVAASFIKNAAKAGTRLLLCDPRITPLARHATWHLAFKPDTDVALLNALLHVIIHEGLVDRAFIDARVEGFDALVASVANATPEAMAPICGIDANTLREVARAFATSRASMILWGMGISQHVHGTDNARCLIALSLITGQIGRPGTGLHPLRGQNNVQGASDAGLIPMMLPNYQHVSDDDKRMTIQALWGAPLSNKPGLTVVEIMHAASHGDITGMFVEGENPAMSDPNLTHARQALATLQHLVVQDIFPTETAVLADVVLPASAFAEKWGTVTNTDRLIQMGRPALPPPGDARQDLWIIEQLGRRLGLPWQYWQPADAGPQDGHAAVEAPVARVYEEMRQTMAPLAGVPWTRLAREDAVVTPALNVDAPGDAIVFIQDFPRASGRAKLVPTTYLAGPEKPNSHLPLTLSTGRVLEHWHTGSMTRRATALATIAPEARLTMHPADAAVRGVTDGANVTIASAHGTLTARAELSQGVKPGQVFMPFAFWESPANQLTGDAIDPVGKIPGFKVTAVEVTKRP
jgi:formate dehydrogenase major subunit